MDGLAAHWPMMWLIMRLMVAAVPAVMIAVWPIAYTMRKRAYGDGGARRAPGEYEGEGWQISPVQPSDDVATAA